MSNVWNNVSKTKLTELISAMPNCINKVYKGPKDIILNSDCKFTIALYI